jgi:hypothetical protein
MTLEDVGPDLWRHCAALEVEMTLLIYPVVVGQGARLFPRHRPGHSARPGGLAVHPEGGNDPGLPAHRPPAVRNGHDLKQVT